MEQMGRCAESLSLYSRQIVSKNKVQFWHQSIADSLSREYYLKLHLFIYLFSFWGKRKGRRLFHPDMIRFSRKLFTPFTVYVLLVWWWWDWNAYVFKLLMRGWDFWAHGSPMALLLGLIFNQTNGQMINGKRNWKWASERAHTHTQILFPLSVLFFFSVLINGEWNEQERFSISKKETGPAAHLLSSRSL